MLTSSGPWSGTRLGVLPEVLTLKLRPSFAYIFSSSHCCKLTGRFVFLSVTESRMRRWGVRMLPKWSVKVGQFGRVSPSIERLCAGKSRAPQGETNQDAGWGWERGRERQTEADADADAERHRERERERFTERHREVPRGCRMKEFAIFQTLCRVQWIYTSFNWITLFCPQATGSYFQDVRARWPHLYLCEQVFA